MEQKIGKNWREKKKESEKTTLTVVKKMCAPKRYEGWRSDKTWHKKVYGGAR